MGVADPAQRDSGNYAVIANVEPDASGNITLNVAPESATPGNNLIPAVNAIQLVKVTAQFIAPRLAVAKASGSAQVSVSWDAAAAGGRLEASATLAAGAAWNPVEGVANPLTGAGSASIASSSGTLFFRVRK